MSDNTFGNEAFNGSGWNQQAPYGAPTPPPAPKKHRRWPWVLLVVVVVLGVIGAFNGSGDKEPESAAAFVAATPAEVYVPPTFTAPTARMVPAKPAEPPSPLTTDGTYKVGAQIQPGDYSYALSSSTGYWATCSDITCDPFGGMIDNDFVTAGTGYLTISPSALYVQLRGLDLTPA